MQNISDLQLDLFDACCRPPPLLDMEIYNELANEPRVKLTRPLSQKNPEEKFEWTDEGISQLHIAVLERALVDLKSTHEHLSELRRECITWIFDDSAAPFSFLICCYEADYNPDVIRGKIRELSARKVISL